MCNVCQKGLRAYTVPWLANTEVISRQSGTLCVGCIPEHAWSRLLRLSNHSSVSYTIQFTLSTKSWFKPYNCTIIFQMYHIAHSTQLLVCKARIPVGVSTHFILSSCSKCTTVTISCSCNASYYDASAKLISCIQTKLPYTVLPKYQRARQVTTAFQHLCCSSLEPVCLVYHNSTFISQAIQLENCHNWFFPQQGY